MASRMRSTDTMPLASTGTSVTRQPRRASAFMRVEHGLVFDRARDQVLAPGGFERLGGAADRDVVALGAAGREDDLGRVARR